MSGPIIRIGCAFAKWARGHGLVLGLMAAALMPAQAQLQSPVPHSTEPTLRLVVLAHDGTREQDVRAAHAPWNGRSQRVARSNLHLLELPNGSGPMAAQAAQAALERLRRHPLIRAAELDRIVRPALSINDPYQGALWHLQRLGADAAWQITTGQGITLAVLDSGVLATHPDLQPNLVPGWNVVDQNTDTRDLTGHGTSVAGAAAARVGNGLGLAGLAGQARIMPVRVTRPDGSAYVSDVAKGIIWAADHGARVVNASFAGLTESFAVGSAAQYLRQRGGLLFVPAGNQGQEESWPAHDQIIAVSATTALDQLAPWASTGAHVTVAAPGEGIWTTSADGGYTAANGSSIASPLAAAAAALVMSAVPNASADDVLRWLLASAQDLGVPGRDNRYGHGLVQAHAAVALALKETGAAVFSGAAGQAPVTNNPSTEVNDRVLKGPTICLPRRATAR